MKRLIRLAILSLVVLILVSAASTANARSPSGFVATALQTGRALRSGDWNALQPLMAPVVCFVTCEIVHPSAYSASSQEQFPPMFDPDATRPASHQYGYEAATVHRVVVTKPLPTTVRKELLRFCSIVRHSYISRPRSIRASANLAGSTVETETFFGPALEGESLADESWRVQFERIGGRWKIRYLILAEAS